MQRLTVKFNRAALKAMNLCNSALKARLTNRQRFEALLTMGFFFGLLLLPHSALAQLPGAPLSNGAGQGSVPGSGGQCGQSFWFLSNLYSYIARAFAGLGGASDSVCQIINIVVVVSVFAMAGMILWGFGDNQMNSTPLKKAFQPFVGWLVGLFCVYFVIFVAFFGSNVGSNVGRAPGVAN